MSERVELELPLARDWVGVVRIVMGGIGERLELRFDELDDVQLAVERLLDEAAPASADTEARVTIAFELDPERLRVQIGPLAAAGVGPALEQESQPGEFGLRRVLETVVDSFDVVDGGDGRSFVSLEKRLNRLA